MTWEIKSADSSTGLTPGDFLDFTGTAIKVTRAGVPRSDWGTNYEGTPFPVIVEFGGELHKITHDGRSPGTLECARGYRAGLLKECGTTPQVVWTAQEGGGSAARYEEGGSKREKKEKEANETGKWV